MSNLEKLALYLIRARVIRALAEMRRARRVVAGMKGVSLRARQLSVGHTSASTTERYDHARDARAMAVGDVFADIASDR